jgi:hypothetical protein
MEILGFVLMAIGGLWLVGKAFSEGLLWGLGCLFIPFVTLYFALTRFENTKVPFGIWVAGWALVFVGVKA